MYSSPPRASFFALAAGLASLSGCASDPEARPERGQAEQDAGPSTDSMVESDGGAESPDASILRTPGYMVIQDDPPEGIMFEQTGSDIDAVMAVCAGRSMYVVETWGGRIATTEDLGANVQGAPQGDCEPAECATQIPLGKWIGLTFESPVGTGCQIEVYEAADNVNDRYKIFVCSAPDFSPGPCRLIGSGTDGVVTAVGVPAP